MRESGERHAWELGRGWDLYFTGAVTALVVLNLLTAEPGVRLWAATALMGSLIPLYWSVARRLNRRDQYRTPKTLLFVLVVAGICAAAILLNQDLGVAVTALAPLCFMTGGAGYGTLALGVMVLVPWPLLAHAGDAEPLSLLPVVLINLVLLALAYLFGRWCEKVIVQSWERAELIEHLRQSRAEAARLSEQAGAMAERERLAREMHDTLAQGFTSIITLAQAVESELDTDPAAARRHLALMRETATDNLAEARAMVAARGPVLLEEDDLDAALDRLAGRLGAELGISVEAETVGRARPLSGNVQVCLLRTAQEALANVRKHAGAASVRIRLAHTDVGVSLSVADDGSGFDPDRAEEGNGIANMRRRARDLGGGFDVESVPGHGTTVRLTLVTDALEEETTGTGGSEEADAGGSGSCRTGAKGCPSQDTGADGTEAGATGPGGASPEEKAMDTDGSERGRTETGGRGRSGAGQETEYA